MRCRCRTRWRRPTKTKAPPAAADATGRMVIRSVASNRRPSDQRRHVGRLIARPAIVLQIGAAYARRLHLDDHVEPALGWVGHVEIGDDTNERPRPHVSPSAASD